jgi:hypothetical protein
MRDVDWVKGNSRYLGQFKLQDWIRGDQALTNVIHAKDGQGEVVLDALPIPPIHDSL